MPSAAVSAQGSTIQLGNSADPVVYTKVNGVTSFTGMDGAASEIDVTDLDSTAKETRLGLVDNGNFNFDINVNRADAGQQALEAARVSGVPTPCKLTLPDGYTGTFTILVKTTPLQGGVDKVLTGTVATRITGAIVWTAPA